MNAMTCSILAPGHHDSLSEEAIRRLYRPNYRHRFCCQTFRPGTEFAGVQRVSTCYVLTGACEFTFDGQSVTLATKHVVALPGGQ
jgi:hypothetical protein